MLLHMPLNGFARPQTKHCKEKGHRMWFILAFKAVPPVVTGVLCDSFAVLYLFILSTDMGSYNMPGLRTERGKGPWHQR